MFPGGRFLVPAVARMAKVAPAVPGRLLASGSMMSLLKICSPGWSGIRDALAAQLPLNWREALAFVRQLNAEK